MEWSVNCMFPKSLTVLNSRCAHKQSCSVLATTNMFGDPCPGTHKYLEAHYQCISALQTSTTTNRPSPPPWVLANNPPLLPNGSSSSSSVIPAILAPPLQPAALPPAVKNPLTSSMHPPTVHTTLPGGRLKAGSNHTALKSSPKYDPSQSTTATQQQRHHVGGADDGVTQSHHVTKAPLHNVASGDIKGNKNLFTNTNANTTTPPNSRILSGVGGMGSDDGILLTVRGQQPGTSLLPNAPSTATTSNVNNNSITMGGASGTIRAINNINNLNTGVSGEDESNMFCRPTNARNLFWNMTRVGDVNVQPCPGGATGIAKWRCVLMKRLPLDDDDLLEASTTTTVAPLCNGSNCEAVKLSLKLRNFEPTWHPLTPDLTQCRSLWLNNLEVRVNQRDSSLISIANDLSEVTSSKTLYGGDMLVTTKIIQTMSEKMFHDKETFPDQRLREAMILELLQGVVKTGSNLLDESQLSSWLDLNQEDQMRVATSLLTGLEDNAFLLADTIIRERNVVQKVKNILLSVRVLETKNIQNNVVFPDAEQWQISDDRIELPKAALVENSEGGLVRIVFAAFDRLESILKPSYDHFDLKSARSYIRNTAILNNDSESSNSPLQQRIRILNSKVISASLGKGRHIQLSQPIKLILRHLKIDNVTNPTCVFWNYIDHAWSANGCALESTNRTHSICMCNHLTNFAILMDVLDDHTHSLFTMFDGNMRILIYVSVSICLVFIVIALLTLKIFNGVFIKSARTSIYRSIYICLLLIELLFLLGIEQTETSILCGFTTVFLHCTILTVIAWFCFEAFQSYTTLTTDDILLEVDQTSKVNCYYLLSYGLSFTIVAISLAIKPSTYTQNDYCVLMEANGLFYATFITPIVLFVMGALCYTFLSWMVMCRKCRSTLKNKEHTRLTNVRFDIRCSFVFLLLLCTVWFMAYWYLRYAKMDDEVAQVYGYLFISFNTLMGVYIFVFHCIQNEKIRREYRKYVRQNSWLPKCMRCSKTSISSGIVGGGSACGMTTTGATIGTLNGTSSTGNAANLQGKKSKLVLGDNHENDSICNNNSATEDAVMISSDCELSDIKTHRLGTTTSNNLGNGGIGGVTVVGAGSSIKSGIIAGNLMPTLAKGEPLQSTTVFERNTRNNMSVMVGGGNSGTLRSNSGLRTPSAGHTSPTSSVSSSHLIFNHSQKAQQVPAGNLNVSGQESFYHQPEYYEWQQKVAKKGHFHGSSGTTGAHPQTHEFFYWTQKPNQSHSKKKRGSVTGSDSPSGSLHSRNTASSQQILFYPSYKKTTLKHQQQQQQQQSPHHQQYPHYVEAYDAGTPAYYQQQQQQHQQQQKQQRRPQSHQQYLQQKQQQQQQQQQLSSDEEQMEPAAHAHLLQQISRRGMITDFALPPTSTTSLSTNGGGGGGGGSQQQHHNYYNRNKHSNCDLSQQQSLPIADYDRRSVSGSGGGAGGSETYYNQGSLASDNGPVYEEILSNRTSDVQHYNVDDMLPPHDYEDEHAMQATYRQQQQQQQQLHQSRLRQCARGGRGDVRSLHNYGAGDFDDRNDDGSPYSDQDVNNLDDDEDDGEEEEEEEVDDDDGDDDNMRDDDHRRRGHNFRIHSDERMRRLMAMQDADFQRRFQRHLRKNGATVCENAAAPPAYKEYHDVTNQYPPQQQQQQQQSLTVFGVSSGAGGSVRSFKKTTAPTSGSRLAVNELFNHGPPLPPANQHPMHKKSQKQQQQQQLTQAQQQHHHQQQQQQQVSPQTINSLNNTPVGRNISAMLEENNTVRCYLEPLDK